MIDLKAFKRASGAASLLHMQGRLKFNFGETDLHLAFRRSPGAKLLLVSFHGAVDRQKRSLPVFAGILPQFAGSAHQLVISDPSLRVNDELRVAWFAGDEHFRMQELFSELVQDIAATLGVSGTIYFGSSAGGFAALNYSWRHPGSLALVSNPQTRISSYYKASVDAYVRACWPERASLQDLPDTVVTDVCSLYRQKISNYVIYVQNSTDEFHLYGHAAPFMEAVAHSGVRNRVTFESLFSGKLGHSHDWPTLDTWMRAAAIAPNWTTQTIVKVHDALRKAAMPPPAPVPVTAAASKPREPVSPGRPDRTADFEMATMLRDFELKRR